MPSFVSAFLATFGAILDIFFVIACAGFLVRKGIVTQAHVSGLVAVTVNVFLPALMFSNVVTTFDPKAFSFWWVIPLSAVAMSGVGFGMAVLVFWRRLREAKDLLPLVGLQNAGYLVLPVGLRLFPDRFETFALYTFLFIMGINPVLWSVGPLLASERGATRGWRGLVTPPFVSSLLGITCAALGARPLIPGVLMNAATLMGQAAVPVATFALGAILGGVPCCVHRFAKDASVVGLLKLIVQPAVVMAVLGGLGIHRGNDLLADFYVIQAGSAPATGIILQVRAYGGDEGKIGSVMLVAYALCALTLPLCLVSWWALAS